MSDSPDTPSGTDELLCRAVDSLVEGLFIVNPERRIVFFSARAEELTGLRAGEVLGCDCTQILRGGHCEQPDCLAHVNTLEPRVVDLVFPDARQLRVRQYVRALHSDDGRPLGGMVCFSPDGAPFVRPASAILPASADAFRQIIGRSPAIRKVVDTIRRAAPSEATMLITGESGTGKELVARAIHDASRRAAHPFVAVNSAAIPHDLLESELFGHVRGAFTGALRDRRGQVALADGGTLFLDEIGDLAMPLQSKILRLLQERTYQRVGDSSVLKANLRIVAATNVDLRLAVAEGRFRQDLYFRLAVIPLCIPPLRERREDVPPMANYLLSHRSVAAGRKPMRFSPEAMRLLETAGWEGNVRQLVNVVDYVVALCESDTVDARALPEDLSPILAREAELARRTRYQGPACGEEEAELIRRTLEAHGFRRQQTADALGMDRVTLYRKMRDYAIATDDEDHIVPRPLQALQAEVATPPCNIPVAKRQ
jgi:transcriptional regulator with PAS, ATPase and Fis domain